MTSAPSSAASVADFVAGAFAAILTKSVVYPLETRAVLLQIGAATEGALDARLYHGVRLACFESAHFNGWLWLLKERVRLLPLGRVAQLLCAANVTALVNHPLANTKAVVQGSIGKGRPVSPLAAAQGIMAAQGPRGFWAGLPWSVLLSGNNVAILYFYEALRAVLDRRFPAASMESFRIFASAVLGSVGALLLFQPLITLRSRIQTAAATTSTRVVSRGAAPGGLAYLLSLYAGVSVMCATEAVKVGFRILVTERLTRAIARALSGSRSKTQPVASTNGEYSIEPHSSTLTER